MDFANAHYDGTVATAAIIAAVATPWGLLQGALFKFALDLRKETPQPVVVVQAAPVAPLAPIAPIAPIAPVAPVAPVQPVVIP